MPQLIKLARFTPGTAGSEGTPGDPGEPPRPGYYTYVVKIILATHGGLVLTGEYSRTPEDLRLYGEPGRPIMIWVPGQPETTLVEKVWVPGTPGRPPTPGVPAVPPTLDTEFGAGWDGGGTSIASLQGDAELTFTVPSSAVGMVSGGAVGVVCGISAQRGGGGYSDIDFALYVSHGKARVIESGVFAQAAQHTYAEGAELRIARRLGVVTYSIAGVAIYTSAGLSAGQVSARASLFMPGDAVVGAALERSQSQGASSHGGLRPLASLSSAKKYTSSASELHPLESASTGRDLCGGNGLLHALTGLSSNKRYATGTGALHPLEGAASTGIVPDYILSAGVLAPLSGVSIGTSGGVLNSSGGLAALVGKSSDRPYAEAVTTLAPLSGFSADVLHILNYFTGSVRGRFTLDAAARSLPANAAAVLAPAPTLRAFTGAALRTTAPHAGLSIAGTLLVTGRAALLAPAAVIEAAGTVAAIGGTIAAAPRAGVVAFGGGTASATAPCAVLAAEARTDTTGRAALTLRTSASASGFAGAVLTQRLFSRATLQAGATAATAGSALLTAPAPAVVAAGTLGPFGAATLLMPMPWVSATPSRAALQMPTPFLVATGGAALQPWGGAWAFNAYDPPDEGERLPQRARFAASRYTNYPFLRIVRFGEHHYGVSATGVYRLGGDTDAGEPIAWALETPVSDFGSPQRKSMVSAYVSANLGLKARAKAVVGEHGSHEYTYPNVRGTAIQNHRVAFGRGMRSRYYGVRIEDESGGELHLDSIDLEVADLTRRI